MLPNLLPNRKPASRRLGPRQRQLATMTCAHQQMQQTHAPLRQQPGGHETAATGLPDEPPSAMAVAVRDVQLDAANIRVCWLPSTEIFEFTIDETTTTLALKVWLSTRVGCHAPHMHIYYGITQLPDEVPLSQYAGHGDTVDARPKRGG